MMTMMAMMDWMMMMMMMDGDDQDNYDDNNVRGALVVFPHKHCWRTKMIKRGFMMKICRVR